ncbi:Prolyl endopeptidase [termite gut metagenome]|uniref:Prolyl endopeptidase n=1 Tax=termite gut metagenome TaxID=433724 RepID=A0A5J4SMN3_9ZZZZ
MTKTVLLLFIGSMALSCSQKKQIVYPQTKKTDVVDIYFDTEVSDPYRWLENDTSAATATWVEAQNKVTNEYLNGIPFRKALLGRLTELANYEKRGAPFKKYGKYYFYKNDGLQNQFVLYVQETPDGEANVFLDPNKLSEDGTVALTGISFSNNGKYLAYTVSRSGSDWREIYVMNIATGELLEDHIVRAKFTDASWRGNGFYYSAYDAPNEGSELSGMNENHKIYYHTLGQPQSNDKLTYQNPQYAKRFYSASVTEDEKALFIYESGE